MHEKKNTILVVDDEPQIQKMLGILLDVENFKIVESLSGKQAIRMCVSTKPDLILLDLGLPDMDGKEVITASRQTFRRVKRRQRKLADRPRLSVREDRQLPIDRSRWQAKATGRPS